MVYFLSSLPTAVSTILEGKGGCGDICYLFARGVPIIYKMFAIHIVMSTYWIFSTTAGFLVYWVWTHPEEDSLGSWREFWIYLNIYSGLFSFFMFLLMNILNISLYNGIRDRIVPVPEGSLWGWVYRYSFFHYFFMLISAILVAPVMNTAGGIAEWTAAIKTAKSHKFEYEVALKPQAAKNRK